MSFRKKLLRVCFIGIVPFIGGAYETKAESSSVSLYASYYGVAHNGKPMASCVFTAKVCKDTKVYLFDMHALTVAHKTYPFGTQLLLSNPTTGLAVEAVVCDRGPYIPGRQLDVSERIAELLGFHTKGHTMLRATILTLPKTKAEIAKGRASCASPSTIESPIAKVTS